MAKKNLFSIPDKQEQGYSCFDVLAESEEPINMIEELITRAQGMAVSSGLCKDTGTDESKEVYRAVSNKPRLQKWLLLLNSVQLVSKITTVVGNKKVTTLFPINTPGDYATGIVIKNGINKDGESLYKEFSGGAGTLQTTNTIEVNPGNKVAYEITGTPKIEVVKEKHWLRLFNCHLHVGEEDLCFLLDLVYQLTQVEDIDNDPLYRCFITNYLDKAPTTTSVESQGGYSKLTKSRVGRGKKNKQIIEIIGRDEANTQGKYVPLTVKMAEDIAKQAMYRSSKAI